MSCKGFVIFLQVEQEDKYITFFIVLLKLQIYNSKNVSDQNKSQLFDKIQRITSSNFSLKDRRTSKIKIPYR